MSLSEMCLVSILMFFISFPYPSFGSSLGIAVVGGNILFVTEIPKDLFWLYRNRINHMSEAYPYGGISVIPRTWYSGG